jgi:hypothetical protein
MPAVPTPIADPSPIDLITGTYSTAALAAAGITLTAAQVAIQGTLITAASREFLRYCGRPFALQTFDEIVSPAGGREDRGEPASAKLSYFPVATVSRCNTGRSTVLTIVNTNMSTNQFATVAFVTSGDVEYLDLSYTGLVLTRVASGVTTTTPLPFASYATIAALAAAINALGSGWVATVAGGTPSPGLYAPTELVGAREPKNAFSPGAALDVFTTPASSYSIDRRTGIASFYGDASGWAGVLSDPSFGPSADGFGCYGAGAAWGNAQYRVTYQAGFQTIPESIQQACAELVKLSYERLNVDGAIASESADGYSYAVRQALAVLPAEQLRVLDLYKDWGV